MAHAKHYQLVYRKGREPKGYAVYEPNGARECARRKRQLEGGKLTFVKVKVTEFQHSFAFEPTHPEHPRQVRLRDAA